MGSILIGIFTFILVLVCVFMTLVVLMQKPNADAGMGAALGGGAAEGVFGGETGNVLTKVTVRCIVLYFVISFGLYLAYLYTNAHKAPAIESTAPGINAIVQTTPEKTEAAKSSAAKKQEAAAPASTTPQNNQKK